MSKRITIKQLAATLGVSAATVSRALNDSFEISQPLKEKIKAYAKRVGYNPDRIAVNLRRGKTKTVGVIVPSISYNFNSRAIEGIEKIMIPMGYKVLIFQTMEGYQREKEAVEYLISINIDAVIASISAETNKYDHFDQIRQNEIPLVLIDRTSKYVEASEVVINNELSSYLAVKHLIETGRRKIAWITGPKGLPLSQLRQRGYERALEQFNIPFDPRLICNCTFNTDMGFEATKNLISKNPDIDAIYALNDRIAIGAIGAIHSLNRKIPEDIAVVGFNNEPFDPLISPSLSSVYMPSIKMGEEAARLVLSHLKEKKFLPQKRIFDTNLIVRASSQM
ncbi:MAG: LacI family transcriptional regulator [Cyclobacteriaceae bacterium]|nr:MAG: LacI family transcriptional regulator [Cyclobacteriaceae bacterium]